jgi:hypothetical protein
MGPGMYTDQEGNRYQVTEDGRVGKLAHDGSWRWLPPEKAAYGSAWLQQEMTRGNVSAAPNVRTAGEKFVDDVKGMAAEPELQKGEYTFEERPKFSETYNEGRSVLPDFERQMGIPDSGSPKDDEPSMRAAKKALEKGKKPKNDETAFTGPVADNDRATDDGVES